MGTFYVYSSVFLYILYGLNAHLPRSTVFSVLPEDGQIGQNIL